MHKVKTDKAIENITDSNQKLANALFHSVVQIHIYHLQTKSFSRHKSLENFYKKIDKLLDTYIETFQGKYGILTNYNATDYDNNPTNCILYLQKLMNINNSTIIGPRDIDLDNIKAEINELINRTIYKLVNLS